MNLQKRSIFTLTTTLLLTVIFAILLPSTVSAQETAKTYIIGTDVTFAPFEFKDANGEYQGIDVDLLDAIAIDQGFNYELRPLGFSAALQALETNQVDGMIAGMSITPERQESFDFSEPYFESGVVMAISADNNEITSYEDLEGKTVAIKVGTTGAAFAESIQEEYGFEVNTFEDSANMYEDVQTGNSDAAFEDYPVMAYAIQSGLALQIPTAPEPGDNYGFAVNKDQNAELLEMFNNGLINIRANGTYDEILNNYLGETAQEETSNLGFFGLIQQNGGELLKGVGRTLLLTITAFIIATILGVVFGLFSASPNKTLNWIAMIYVDILRGIPLIVLAFFIYFSIPQFLNIQIPAYVAGVITLSLNTAAYIAELVRGGIQAVDTGQLEASRSLGLTYNTSMRKVVLPQAFKIMIPSFINQFVITLKDTSILSVIGIVELTQTGKIIIARTYSSGNMWLIVGLMYIIIITILTKFSNYLERRLSND
ncbi:amino acid ABC transporter substrate-binding protein/permease [Carnobacterium pleistocenium]|uniref:amino acid ABC transporter substrate-binding protein/permease n=1 Tax=Carnobacterium pleistocenium TaxID=181073 RepID=UPI00054F1F38|nr:amino acid ABC transporter substrate-binding protein/permease [Carnobacterium pleistocenium]